MGGSYGGYATLAGVAFTPDLYAAAVAIVAPSNLITLLESIPPYWEAGRVIFHERMGNPTTPEGRKQLERQSPLNSASKIKTPLLIAQGANDPRVKMAESEQIVIALRDRGFPVEYLVAPDEGHGFARPVNNMALFAASEAFFAKYIGGRAQQGGTPEVVARLKEITVDPKTVVLAKKVDAAAVTAPKPATDLKAASLTYQGSIAAQGQNIPIGVTRTIKEDGATWVVTDTMKMPMGEVVDTTTLEKGTLLVSKRQIKQGPMTIDVAFAGGKATGTVAMGGEPKPIAADLGGALFADGAGVLGRRSRTCRSRRATRPRTATSTSRRPKGSLKQIKVLGAEELKVAAGTFKTWKAEVTSAEGEPGSTTIWVAQDTRSVVKTSSDRAADGRRHGDVGAAAVGQPSGRPPGASATPSPRGARGRRARSRGAAPGGAGTASGSWSGGGPRRVRTASGCSGGAKTERSAAAGSPGR